RVDYASLIVGANDLLQALPSVFSADFVTSFATSVAGNVAAALDTVAAAGHVGLVVGNIPDIAATPGFQAFVSGAFGPDLAPFVLQITTDAVSAANARIESLAEARHVPVVDLFGLTQVAVGPLTFGGVARDEALAPDYFHPDTVGQGILGNTVLE